MSAVGGVELEMSGRCVGSEFALASIHDVDRVPLADAEVFGNVCNEVANKIVQLVPGLILDVVDLVYDLAENALIAVVVVIVTAAARFAVYEKVLAKPGCVEL